MGKQSGLISPDGMIRKEEVVSYVRNTYDIEVSSQTVWRWMSSGVHGVSLEYRRVSGRLFTTERWVDEFIKELNTTKERDYE